MDKTTQHIRRVHTAAPLQIYHNPDAGWFSIALEREDGGQPAEVLIPMEYLKTLVFALCQIPVVPPLRAVTLCADEVEAEWLADNKLVRKGNQ